MLCELLFRRLDPSERLLLETLMQGPIEELDSNRMVSKVEVTSSQSLLQSGTLTFILAHKVATDLQMQDAASVEPKKHSIAEDISGSDGGTLLPNNTNADSQRPEKNLQTIERLKWSYYLAIKEMYLHSTVSTE